MNLTFVLRGVYAYTKRSSLERGVKIHTKGSNGKLKFAYLAVHTIIRVNKNLIESKVLFTCQACRKRLASSKKIEMLVLFKYS